MITQSSSSTSATLQKREKDASNKRGNATAAAAIHDPYFEKIDLSFSNTKECFRNKSTYELVRSIVVFKVGQAE